MPRWSAQKLKLARDLRSTGHTITKIQAVLQRQFGQASYGRIWDYIKNVQILPDFQSRLNDRRSSSSFQCKREWDEAAKIVETFLHKPFSNRELLLIALMLYWAEGYKRDLCISNGDPVLLKTFKQSLQRALSIPNDRFNFSLLLYGDLDRARCVNFWSNILDLPVSQLKRVWIRKGKEQGKLEYGMCIIRVRTPRRELKFLLTFAKSMIGLLTPAPIA